MTVVLWLTRTVTCVVASESQQAGPEVATVTAVQPQPGPDSPCSSGPAAALVRRRWQLSCHQTRVGTVTE